MALKKEDMKKEEKKEKQAGAVYQNTDLAFLEEKLLPWFEEKRRELPWRKETRKEPEDGYRVWISEIMLQQTRVEAVKEYYCRFLKELPDIEALSKVEDDRLLKLWEGLGYYSRARNLKKAAIMVMDSYHGIFPQTYEELLKLPGVGSYTAGAIASIAYENAVPAVDGNVLRVVMRFMGCYDDIMKAGTKKKLENSLKQVMTERSPGEFNQALMELGAIVCIPNGAPHCEECPLSELCVARKKQLICELPVKTKLKKRKIEKKTVILYFYQGKTAIRKRPENGLLAGLFEFPMEEGQIKLEEFEENLKQHGMEYDEIGLLGQAKHIFSHIEWHMTGYSIQIKKLKKEWAEQFLWVRPEELEEVYALPGAFSFFREKLADIK